MELIFKIAAIGILVAILNIVLSKAGRDEYVMLTTLAAIVTVALMLVDKIKELFTVLESLFTL